MEKDVTSTLSDLQKLNIEPDLEIAGKLTVCVDRMREETDAELSEATSSIRMQRLAAEMERLTELTHRVTDVERALLRALSKRDRLVQAFERFRKEIEDGCSS